MVRNNYTSSRLKVFATSVLLGLASLVGFMIFLSIAKANNIECLTVEGKGDKASYEEGWHQIFDSELMFGADDVYTKDYGYLQCFCAPDGNGIQTVWTLDEEASVSGEVWGLGDYTYNPINSNYYCGLETPTETSTASPSATPTPIPNEAPRATPFPTEQPHISTPEPTAVILPDEGFQPLGVQK